VLASEGELEPFGTDAASLSKEGAVACETFGKEGARLHHGGTVTELSDIPTEEVDTTGAGDAFAGTFLAVYVRSGDPVLGARESNAAGAARVKALGPMENGHSPRSSRRIPWKNP
jgi:sugar/nucleoside kinase (ribokinase family)